jgi:TRAP-type mannitol/chloroaromatic compound transport system permease small subunit
LVNYYCKIILKSLAGGGSQNWPLQIRGKLFFQFRVEKRFMQKVFRIIDSLNEGVGKALSFGVVIIILIVVYDVILRTIFDAPTEFVPELSEYILLAIGWLCGGYVLKHKGHVALDVVHKRFTPKTKAIVDLMTSVLFFLFCGVLLWRGWNLTWDALKLQHKSQVLGIPLFFPYLIIPLGSFLIIIQGIKDFINNLMVAIHQTRVERTD